ncbi:hypothetical protein HOY82DRAFT_647053 [Tuber indicum]|nr:hypothetical protein HOY82DRAFT_647053 [Tuber indicum]
MSPVFTDHSLIATFDNLLERGDYVPPDSEFFILLLDNEPRPPAVYNTKTEFTRPSGTNSAETGVDPVCCTSPESSPIEVTEKDVAVKELKKKRKSWGEELPIPTTNLPPQKRAKTAEEKEQRWIERTLRNWASAQSSCERKQKEVETLEQERRSLAGFNAELRATSPPPKVYVAAGTSSKVPGGGSPLREQDDDHEFDDDIANMRYAQLLATGEMLQRQSDYKDGQLAGYNEKIASLELHNAALVDKIKFSRNSDKDKSQLRNRFISTFKRDVLKCGTAHDRTLISEGDEYAHGGDATADARLYSGSSCRKDVYAFETLYGV